MMPGFFQPCRWGGTVLGWALLAAGVCLRAQWVTVDPAFPAGGGPDSTAQAIALQSDGGILIGGLFTNVNNLPQPHCARLNPDGSLDSAFRPQINGNVTRLSVLPDGRILLSGSFTNAEGAFRAGLARLKADGGLDTNFVPPQVNSPWADVVGTPSPDGSIPVSANGPWPWGVLPRLPPGAEPENQRGPDSGSRDGAGCARNHATGAGCRCCVRQMAHGAPEGGRSLHDGFHVGRPVLRQPCREGCGAADC